MRMNCVLALVMLVAAGTASASAINTLPGDAAICCFGQTDTRFYAQGVVADGLTLSDFSLALAHADGVDLAFNMLVTGARADGGAGLGYAPDMTNILFNSGPELLLAGSGMTTFTESPGISVTNGDMLFLVLDAFSYPTSFAQAAVAGTSTDVYAPGEFVFLNANLLGLGSLAEANGYMWSRWDVPDMAFRANFAAVPEPATVSLFAMGIAGILLRRFHKQK